VVAVSVATLAPFRGGQGGIRMGLKPIAPEDWLESGSGRDARIAEKRALLAQGVPFIHALPESEHAQAELAALLGVAGGLEAAALNTAEDLCLMAPRGDTHVLTAGAVAFPTDWRLEAKLGQPLLGIHQSIPGYVDKLAAGVEQFFARLEPGPIFGRANWFLVETDALRYLPEGSHAERFAGITTETAGRRLFVRCERQTLRRLPFSRAVLFTIGVHVARLDTLAPDLVADLVLAARTQYPAEAARKETAALLPLLEGWLARVQQQP
jgi:hypothetical protein